jgi:uncharacterized membrane protein
MFRRIAPLCYLTFIGFIIAALLFASRDKKSSIDQFHLRQSFGLYVTGLFFYFVYIAFGSNLLYTDLSSMVVFIPLLLLWFLGFKAAMEGKERPMPFVGLFYQKWFAFVGR